MTQVLQLDSSNRIVLTREARQAAGISRRQKLRMSVTPGRIVLEVAPNVRGKVVNRSGLKVWTGTVPETPIAEAVDYARHYER